MPVAELARQHSLTSIAIQGRVQAAVAGAWQAVWGFDDAALEEWLGIAVPIVQAAQLHMGTTTAAYLSAAVADMTGAPLVFGGTPEGLMIGPRIRRGIEPKEVYTRPVVEARSLVAAGLDRNEALRRAGTRAVSLAATDVQSTKLYTAQHFMQTTPGVVGYRRHLTGARSCGLCVVASTRRYHRSELMPRHPGCDCGVLPIVGDHDPGEVLNRELLESMHGAVAETYGPDAVRRSADTDEYHRLYETYNHGEYGPTLVRPGDHVMKTKAASARPEPVVHTAIGADRMPHVDGEKTEKIDWHRELPDAPVGEVFEMARGPRAYTLSEDPGPGYGYITTDGRLFYVENVADDEAGRLSSRLKIEALRKHEAEALPKGMRGTPTTMLVKGVSADDLALRQLHPGSTFTTLGNANGARVVFFGGIVDSETVWHETGHVVARRINETGHQLLQGSSAGKPPNYFSRLRDYMNFRDPSAPNEGMWNIAAKADAEHLRTEVHYFDWEAGRTRMAAPTPNGIGSWEPGVKNYAVSDYAASVPHYTEDFSESWRLMTKSKVEGSIASAYPGEKVNMGRLLGDVWQQGRFMKTITFEDMYPNRVAYVRNALATMGYSLP